jgi:hypothetical protein
MIYSPITKLTTAPHDPRRVTIHLEGQAVKVRFLEDCLYVLPKTDR